MATAARIDVGVPSADVTAALLELAADEQHTQQFVNGILGSTAPVGVDLFAGLEPGPARRVIALRPRRRRSEVGRRAGTQPEASAAEDARERARARSVEQAEVAQRRLDEARSASDAAVAAEAAATRRVDDLRQALAEAEDDLRGASSARRRAASTTATAERADVWPSRSWRP